MTVDDGSDDVERILVVTAHPDDVDFGAAGSVAMWTGRGIEVSYCIVTDGDAGGSDHSITRAEMAAIRREEQLEAARAVGVTDVTFLGFPDGRVTAEPRAAGRHLPGDPPGPPRPGRRPVARAQLGPASTPAIPTTWPRARPRPAPSIPTPATRSPSPSSWRRA